jgi:hypothetical protein
MIEVCISGPDAPETALACENHVRHAYLLGRIDGGLSGLRMGRAEACVADQQSDPFDQSRRRELEEMAYRLRDIQGRLDDVRACIADARRSAYDGIRLASRLERCEDLAN